MRGYKKKNVARLAIAIQVCLALGHKVEGVYAPPHPLRSYTGNKRETALGRRKEAEAATIDLGVVRAFVIKEALGSATLTWREYVECEQQRAEVRTPGGTPECESTSKQRKKSWPES